MKQRYHYNVANSRVEQHVEKGNDDGLYISSVACCQELWALIMDAGTGFTAQVYQLSPQFLPKVRECVHMVCLTHARARARGIRHTYTVAKHRVRLRVWRLWDESGTFVCVCVYTCRSGS